MQMLWSPIHNFTDISHPMHFTCRLHQVTSRICRFIQEQGSFYYSYWTISKPFGLLDFLCAGILLQRWVEWEFLEIEVMMNSKLIVFWLYFSYGDVIRSAYFSFLLLLFVFLLFGFFGTILFYSVHQSAYKCTDLKQFFADNYFVL